MENVVFAIIAISIFLLVFAWISTGKEKSTRSVQKFTVRFSHNYRKLALWVLSGFVCFTLFFSLFYLFGVEFDIEILTMMAVLSVASFLLWTVSSTKQLKVNHDTITYRSMFGLPRKMSAKQIDRVAIESDESLTIYAKGKIFANFGKEYSHLSNLQQYCEKRDIPVQEQDSYPITKWTYLKKVVMIAAVIGVCVGIFINIIVVPIYLIHGGFEVSLLELIIYFVGVGVGVAAIVLVALLPGAVRVLCLVAAQEKALAFSFCEEMQSLGICKLDYESSDWFIALENSSFVVLRRDFVAEFKNRKSITAHAAQVTFIDSAGKNRKVRGTHDRMIELEEWLLSDS